MVKQVPVTTELSQTLNTGSAVQFTGGQVDPMDNKMPGQIRKQSTAMLRMQKASQVLADQLNDAEATKLYNEFAPELQTNHNAYTDLTGFDAVAPIPPDEEGGDYGNTLDVYKNTNLKNLEEKYLKKASNGSVRSMFKAKAHQAIADSQEKMVRHSIEQQKIGATNVLNDHLTITKREIINDFKNYDKEGSVYQTRKFVGMSLIDEIAMVKGWNIDPTKGRVSSNYLALRSAYLHEIGKGVIDMMGKHLPKHKKNEAIRKYIDTYRTDLGEKTADKQLEINEKEGKLNKVSACVEATLKDNGNINDGSFLSAANRMNCLSSSNSFDNGKGVSTNQGLHSDKVNTDETTITDNIEFAEQLINTESKFYKPDSELNGTLLDQHKPTHMFAALHFGVAKADSLYTKAKSQIDIDPKQFKNNPVYAKNINSQIITNYKKLLIEEANKEFKPEIVRLEKEIKKLEDTPNLYTKPFSSLGPIPGTDDYEKSNKDEKKKRKIKQLKNQLKIAKVEDPGFSDKIVNDLDILEGEIDYDYDPQITKELEIDEVSGLQPLNVLIRKLQATIKDPEALQTAVKELKIKHDEITKTSNEVYDQDFKKAKIISFAKEGGYNDLAANGINIINFKEEDQKILKNGQPEKSDIDTLIMLGKNPEELKDNLNKYDYKLNKKDFMALEDYAAKKLDTPEKIAAVKIETDMLDMELKIAGFYEDINDDKKSDKETKQNYLEIKEEWRKRIDEAQIDNGGKTIGREAKRKILKEILNDQVLTGKTTDKFLGIFGGKPEFQPLSTVNQYKGNDDLPTTDVMVFGEKVRLSKIPEYQRINIIRELQRINKPTTEYNIAEYWVRAGKSTATNEAEQLIFIANRDAKNTNKKTEESENETPYMPYFNLPI